MPLNDRERLLLNIRERLLHGFIRNMHDEGFVNDQFWRIQLWSRDRPADFVRTITNYCMSMRELLSQCSSKLEQENIDFGQLNVNAHQLHEESRSIGAEAVRLACIELVRASEASDKDYCSQALYWTKNEFARTRRKFEAVLQGIVNGQFSQIQTLRSVEEPEHVVQLIDSYFTDVEKILSDLTSYIDYPEVDFSKLATLAHKVEERSLSIGAEHVRLACANLLNACDQLNKESFSRALIWIKNEFARTRNKLEAYARVQQRIIRLESKQHSRTCAVSNSPSGFSGGSS